MAGKSGGDGGLGGASGIWSKSSVFPPANPSSADSGPLDSTIPALTSNLSEMALSPEPRPRKIRRRNAITVLDQHQLPMFRYSARDSFESASLLQSLEDQQQLAADISGSSSTSSSTAASPLSHRQQSPAKRKVPKARLKSCSSPTFKKHRLKEENISQIRLHQDLASHMQKTSGGGKRIAVGEILPEAILKSYRNHYQDSLAMAEATRAENGCAAASAADAASSAAAAAACKPVAVAPSPCQALVLYTPPEKIIHQALTKNRQSEAAAKEVRKRATSAPANASKTSNSLDMESMELGK